MLKSILIGILLAIAGPVWAWQPSKPITVVLGFAPGSGNEVMMRRAVAVVNQTHPGVNFVFEFKPGAGEVQGINRFAQAEPDGHTVFVPGMGAWYATPVWYEKQIKQDPQSWIPVQSLGQVNLALLANPNSDVKRASEFIGKIKSQRPVNVAVGAPVHVFAYEFMIEKTRAQNAQRILYNGPAQALAAVIGGQTEFAVIPVGLALQQINLGQVRLIGVTGNQLPAGKNWPMLSNLFHGMSMIGNVGVVLPPGTPTEIVTWWRTTFHRAVNTAEYQQYLRDLGWYHTLNSAEDYARFVAEERKKWMPVARRLPFN